MGKVDENKQMKRNSLLDTAFLLFTNQGINKTSISDIAARAGVAKGTFYLYFKDKYDIRNKLVAHQSSKIFKLAAEAMEREKPQGLEEEIVFLVNYIVDYLNRAPELLGFISKNLSWGIFKSALTTPQSGEDYDFSQIFYRLTDQAGLGQQQAEIMLYLIIELVGASCYNVILYQEPCSLTGLKPYLFETIRGIIRNFLTRPRLQAEGA